MWLQLTKALKQHSLVWKPSSLVYMVGSKTSAGAFDKHPPPPVCEDALEEQEEDSPHVVEADGLASDNQGLEEDSPAMRFRDYDRRIIQYAHYSTIPVHTLHDCLGNHVSNSGVTNTMLEFRLSQAEQAWMQHKNTLCSKLVPVHTKLKC